MSDSGKPSHSDAYLRPGGALRRGWTTGTCAAAAARAACQALFGGGFPDPVEAALPNGMRPSFSLALHETGPGWARAGIVKDAGDDPDVTHGALVVARVSRGQPGSGVTFAAGPGVGTVTRPGLPIPPGEPAINPVPRAMIREAVREAAELFGDPGDIAVEISVPGGEKLAMKTLNGRLGIVGGLSILGTTGIVVPYSCAAWIDTIHRGIDVARAAGLEHIAGATGSVSEAAVAQLYNLPDIALVDMGGFVGGMLKYLKTHPVPRVTIAGGFAKMSKLAAGRLDLHSKRGLADLSLIASWLRDLGAAPAVIEAAAKANTAQEALEIAEGGKIPLAGYIADRAQRRAFEVLDNSSIVLDVIIVSRDGRIVGRTSGCAATVANKKTPAS
ncbi:MAG: cobalt-precorrin-5B (C(1))-methyltransferase [Rhodomicrobium sp.]